MITRLAVLLFVLAVPVLSQEPEPPAPEPEPAADTDTAPSRSPLVAAGWCVVTKSPKPPAPTLAPSADGEEPAEEPEPPLPPTPPEPSVGCDIGAGLALHRWSHAALVAVVGSKSLGAGAAWIPYRNERGPLIAIAIGVVLPYDGDGIYLEGAGLALGATLSFARGGQE